mmetsp:Transcript_21119/g.49876  ORF Transcript_21119/g.49876 Transcript_21119/m.49876 type:complete len:250 (-) Transcript_21119:684-1433(-)
MSGVAKSESSQVLCIAMVFFPPMKISDVYSSMARFESPTYGTCLMTTTWSGCSSSSKRMRFDSTMSSTTFDLEISLLRNCEGALRFFPSLFPKWLYETIETGLIPALTRKSTRTLFILVCPLLKSSPAIKTFFSRARSTTPGTKVFCGEPLMKVQPSKMEATAKMVDALTSASSRWMECRMFSAVSLTPSSTHAKRSVLAVHSRMTLSSSCLALKSEMSFRICSICSCLLPLKTLSARSLWLAAIKSGK